MWDKIENGFIYFGMPTVLAYHLIMSSAFLNTAASDARGLERAADQILAPVQYVLCGKAAERQGEEYSLVQRFDYNALFPIKMTASLLSLPISAPLGSLLKGIAFFSAETRGRHAEIVRAQESRKVKPNIEYYRSLGLRVEEPPLKLEHQNYQREPGAENLLSLEKELLRDIVRIFKENHIPFWVDCGTLIGTFRYGGVIPWDEDVDVAVLEDDFDNIWHALQALDPQKYHVQDWSNRCRPKTAVRVYIKENRNYVDLYYFAIDPESRKLTYILSNEISSFMTEAWKIRERRYTVPSDFATVFPLKSADFDGIEVFVPSDTKKYLQERYGENIAPVKIYNEATGQYEKDLTHPYWQQLYVK